MTALPICLTLFANLILSLAVTAEATPQFARTYRADCSFCHASPPRLNERGLRFLAAGYRLDGEDRSPTIPVAVWNTVDLELRHSADLRKGFPSRVEIISAGPIGRTRAAYFVEWRALSQNIGSNRRLLDRSGRFEDLFVRSPVTSGSNLALSVGQFRALTQVDVSQRLSLSEPLVFSAGLPGRRATTSRLTGLRGFSASGRQPAVRLEYQRSPASSPADGWFTAATVPLTGELTIPFTEAASFELEGRPKGVFIESYWRSGLTSIGAHTFIGDAGRRLATGVVTHDFGNRLVLLAGAGAFHAAGVTDARFSLGGEATISPWLVGGLRVDHRTGAGRDPAVLLYGNGHLPFGPPAFRQAVRLQIEHRIQPSNHATGFALSHVF
ncbi:MAG: hypothetical protein ACT4QD_27555 [Acidobacteriota bacterium]